MWSERVYIGISHLISFNWLDIVEDDRLTFGRRGLQLTDRTFKYRKEICKVGKLLYDKGLIAGTEGNISCRLPSGDVLITPSGVCKGMMEPDELAVVDITGKPSSKSRKPSSEYRIHLLAYDRRPEVQAVVHAHPSYSTGFALAGIAIEASGLPEFRDTFGTVPFVPYGEPGTQELAGSLERFIATGHTYLLENHGLVSLGTTLLEAYFRLEMAEHCAKALYLALQIETATAMDMEYAEDDERIEENSISTLTLPRDRRRREN